MEEPRRGDARRRWGYRLAVLAGLAVAVEAGSWAGWWAVTGRPFSGARLRCRRQRLAEREEAGPTAPAPALAEIHPYLGFSYNPEWPGPLLPGEGTATEWGFADKARRSPVRQRGPGKVVVGILGASVASMFAAQGTEALERELKKSPRFAGKKIEFVSLTVGSFKQPQQLMALNYALALGAEFDVVVNLDGLNEVAWYPQAAALQGVNHLYPTSWPWTGAGLPDQVRRRHAGKIAYLQERRGQLAARFNKAPLCYSPTANLVWALRDRDFVRGIAEAQEALEARERQGLPYGARGPRRRFRTDAEMLGQLVSDWERCSYLIDRECRGHGIRYLHFLQPNQYVPGSKRLSPQEREVAYSADHPARPWIEKGYVLLRQAGKRLAGRGVEFHDLSLAYARSGETFYYDNCCHINRAGAEALAGPIARAILQTKEPPRAGP
jgi:hypothetical protein